MRKALCYATLSLAMLSIAGCSSHCDCSDQTLFESTLNPTPPNELDLEQARQNLAFVSEKTASNDNFEAEFADEAQENSDSTRSVPELELPNIALPQASVAAIQTPIPKNRARRALLAAVPEAVSRPVRSTTEPPRKFERPKLSTASHYMSIMGQDGVVLTVWALAKRNWLWAYAPLDSHSFGTIRNWRIERSYRREHFRFINQRLGTCIQAYGNGLIHDTCDKRNLDQDFELLPTSSGSVFIKSVSQQRCVTYDPVNTHGYDTITLAKCDDNITPLRDQNWYLTPPILPANPDFTWEDIN